MHLLLVRHGQSYINLDNWDGGYVDAGLTALGQQQAARLGQWLADNVQIVALYTSTMARTQETAACVTTATGVAAQPDDRLREFGNCYADGQPVPPEAMPVKYAEFWGTERPYTCIGPRAESWMLFRLRTGTFLDDIIARHGSSPPDTTVVVICHGGVIEAAFDYIFNIGPHRRVEVLTHSTGIVHFEYLPESHRESWRLHAHGLTLHLAQENGAWLGSRPVMRDASRQAPSPWSEPVTDSSPAEGTQDPD